MGASILPIGGIKASSEQWVELPTGANLATFHLIGVKCRAKTRAKKHNIRKNALYLLR